MTQIVDKHPLKIWSRDTDLSPPFQELQIRSTNGHQHDQYLSTHGWSPRQHLPMKTLIFGFPLDPSWLTSGMVLKRLPTLFRNHGISSGMAWPPSGIDYNLKNYEKCRPLHLQSIGKTRTLNLKNKVRNELMDEVFGHFDGESDLVLKTY